MEKHIKIGLIIAIILALGLIIEGHLYTVLNGEIKTLKSEVQDIQTKSNINEAKINMVMDFLTRAFPKETGIYNQAIQNAK